MDGHDDRGPPELDSALTRSPRAPPRLRCGRPEADTTFLTEDTLAEGHTRPPGADLKNQRRHAWAVGI